MNYALVAVAVLTVVLLVVLVVVNRRNQSVAEPPTEKTDRNVECCGAHEVCEAETLLTLSDKIVYYSDEELDLYRGIAPEEYRTEAVEEFREVLLTLQQHEVAGWLKSLQLRRVELPLEIREEALMIMDDFRTRRAAARAAKQQE